MVATAVVPAAPVDGENDTIPGDGGDPTVKPSNDADAPPGMVTVTVRNPGAAPGAIDTFANRSVAIEVVTVAVTPVPLNSTPVAASRFCPNMKALVAEPGSPFEGEINVIAGAPTPKLVNRGPEGVVTVTVCAPRSAPGVIVTVIDTVVAVTDVIAAVTPVPLKVTSVVPIRPCPVSVAVTVVPGAALGGEIDATAGAATEKPIKSGNGPAGVVNVRVRGPRAAPGAIVTTREIEVAPAEAISAVMSPPLNPAAVTPARLVPDTVTTAVCPGAPVEGTIDVIACAATVKLVGTVPAGVATVARRSPSAAPGSIVIANPRLVVDAEVIAAVTPVPLNVTAVAPARFCPERVAAIVVPSAPDDGDIDVTASNATVKLPKGVIVPAAAVTNAVRAPKAASGAILTIADRLVDDDDVITAVTPVPLKVRAVAPERVWPERATAICVPGAPDDGKIEAAVGTTTVKPLKLPVPSGDSTVTVRKP